MAYDSESSSTGDEKTLPQLVSERYEQSTRARQHIIDEMEYARLMYRGDQWLKYSNQKWIPAPQPKYRVRLTINKLPPLVELCVSTFLRYKPIIIANPGTDEDEDRKTAKTSEMLLRYLWDYLEFDEFLVRALTWVFVCGSCFLRTRWDPMKGKKIPVMDQKDPTKVKEYVHAGSAAVDVISPFSMSIEPGAERLEDAAWCIITEMLRKDQVEQMFKLKKPLPHSTATDEALQIPMLLERDAVTPVQEDRVALHCMYERPTKKHPLGRIVYVANQTTLWEGELPNGEIRIEHLKGIILPGELWPSSIVSQVTSLQMEINRGRSQLIENRNLCSRPQLMAAIGSMEDDMVDNRPGNINWWDPVAARGIEPHYLTPPSVPTWVTYLLELAAADMMDLASRHEASQGQQASNITSGRQAAMFRSADDSRLAPSIRLFEQSLKKVGQHLLATCKEHMDGPQVISIVGKNRMAEVHKFMANDINEKCNVTYEIASQLPWARESMRQQIMYLNQQGKIDDETMFTMLELPTVQRLYESEQEHRMNARLENQLLAEMKVPPLTTDNHQVHLKEHERQVNLPENRQAIIMEMQNIQKMNQMLAQMPGAEEQQQQQQQYPQAIMNLLEHMEEHRKMIPQPQPPPPAVKMNFSVDRLMQNPLFASNPQLAAKVIPILLEMMQDAVGQPATPSNQPGGAPAGVRAPSQEMPGMPSMTGGFDAKIMHGSEAGANLNPNVADTLGGPDLGPF